MAKQCPSHAALATSRQSAKVHQVPPAGDRPFLPPSNHAPPCLPPAPWCTLPPTMIHTCTTTPATTCHSILHHGAPNCPSLLSGARSEHALLQHAAAAGVTMECQETAAAAGVFHILLLLFLQLIALPPFVAGVPDGIGKTEFYLIKFHSASVEQAVAGQAGGCGPGAGGSLKRRHRGAFAEAPATSGDKVCQP